MPLPQVVEQEPQEPHGPTSQSPTENIKFTLVTSCIVLYCIKYSLPGVMHATTQFNVWASSMIRDVAHFSPPLCASEISSLHIKSVRSSYFDLKCGTLFSPCPILFAQSTSSRRQVARCPLSPRPNITVNWVGWVTNWMRIVIIQTAMDSNFGLSSILSLKKTKSIFGKKIQFRM